MSMRIAFDYLPLQFYLVGFLVVLVVGKLGNWVSMALVLQLLGVLHVGKRVSSSKTSHYI